MMSPPVCLSDTIIGRQAKKAKEGQILRDKLHVKDATYDSSATQPAGCPG